MEKKSEEGDYPFSSSQPILPLKYLTNPVLQNVVLNNISSPKSVAHKGSFSSYPSSSVTMEEKSMRVYFFLPTKEHKKDNFVQSPKFYSLEYLTNPVLQNVVLNDISSPKLVAHKGSLSSMSSIVIN
jgi:hypothetical protein